MDMKDTLGVLLAGGAGERLFPLTRDRAKPAVPFGGHYRIIDITLSNCINSGLRRVYVLTQYKALSLNRHIREGWTGIVAQELGEFFELMPPMQRTGRQLVHGHGGCGVPEHLFDRQRAAEARDHSVGRPHLQDGLQPHAGLPQGDQRRGHAGDAADCARRGFAVRRGGGGHRRAKCWASRRSRRRRASARRSIPTPWMRRWAFTSSTPRRC